MYFEANIWLYCKKDCIFCSEGWFWKRSFLSFEAFQKTMKQKSFQKVVFTGWEPITNPRIFEYIRFCKENGISTSLVTAFEIDIEDTFIQKLYDSWLDELMISIQWPEKIHDSLVKQKGSFHSIMKLLTILQSKKNIFRVILHTNLNTLNYKTLPFFIQKMLSLFSCISTYHIQALEYDGKAIEYEHILFGKFSLLLKPFFDNIEKIHNIDKVKMGRIPFCVVPKPYRFLVSQTPDIYQQRDNIYKEEMIYKEHVYTQKCWGCQYESVCDKFFNFYVEKFGDAELRNIS